MAPERRTKSGWSAIDIPPMAGRRVVVTGANSGLGLQTSLELARRGASVTMACRDPKRGADALAKVRSQSGAGDVRLASLDLADLASVRRFAEEHDGPVDVLVNNAGVMAVPEGRTKDGFETQFGTNHLGHFALTGLLLPALRQGTDPRVVVVSSAAHRSGRIDFDDLQGLARYRRWKAYGQSKLANLLFARELDRRLRAHGDELIVASAHPGIAATNLMGPIAKSTGPFAGVVTALVKRTSQSDAEGALPSLYAASMPDVVGGDYFGPDGFGEQRGAPKRVGRTARAQDDAVAARLWSVSSELTGVVYPDLPDPVGTPGTAA